MTDVKQPDPEGFLSNRIRAWLVERGYAISECRSIWAGVEKTDMLDDNESFGILWTDPNAKERTYGKKHFWGHGFKRTRRVHIADVKFSSASFVDNMTPSAPVDMLKVKYHGEAQRERVMNLCKGIKARFDLRILVEQESSPSYEQFPEECNPSGKYLI